EIDAWILGLLKDGWDRVARRVQQENHKMEDAIDERLAGLGIRAHHASVALRNVGLSGLKPADWPADGLEQLAKELRRASKPIVVAWNKVDAVTDEELATLTATGGVVVSAQAELALGRGAAAGTFSYAAGSPIVRTQQLSEAQEKGLQYLESQVLNRFGETGVHKALETAVFEKLGRIPVFPVEDESKLTDKEGRVLPDCHLVKTGTTAKQLAYLVHTDLGDKFVRGIDCRTKRVIGADHVLAAGDIIKIAANA
ncbi:MAG: TGS domain-containing protein, partial [Thermoplasmatota archaeon]